MLSSHNNNRSIPSTFPKVSLVLFLLIIISQLTGCAAGFVARASYEEARILFAREPISEVLRDEALDQETREKLELVVQAKDYAREIGLSTHGNFESYSDIGREHLVWVLSASPSNRLQPKTWWFPIVGSIPYRGYFDKTNGEEAAKELQNKGWDTYLRHSPAFSTLGWFEDPLLNTTLAFKPQSLVDTVFHEVFHTNYWLKSQAQFNESAANFIGGILASEFFSHLAKSDETKLELLKLSKRRMVSALSFSKYLETAVPKIEKFYEENQSLPKDEFEQKKKDFFEKLSEEAKRTWGLKKTALSPNNARLVAQRTYYRGLVDFCRLYFHLNSDIGAFTDFLEDKIDPSSPFKSLNEYLDSEAVSCPLLQPKNRETSPSAKH